MDGLQSKFEEKFGHYNYGKITQFPNRKRNIRNDEMKYDTSKIMTDENIIEYYAP